MKAGGPLTTRDNRGSTPLHRAARIENAEILKFLLGKSKGKQESIDVRDDDGMTPLHIAARYGRHDSVHALISNHCDITAKTTDKSTSLHEAALGGHQGIVNTILDATADQTYQRIGNSNGETALFCASRLGFDKIVQILLTKAMSIKIELECDDQGRLPIHIAAQKGYKTTVKLLFNQNRDTIEMLDHVGSTHLSLAASGSLEQHADTVRFLVEKAAAILHKQWDGATPILLAAKNGNVQSMKYLLREGSSVPVNKKADIDERDSRRSTPAYGHEEATLLLERGAKDVTKRETGDVFPPARRDPLSWAAGNGQLEGVKKLLAIPEVLIDSSDELFLTLLSWAAENGRTAVVSQLLRPTMGNRIGAKVDTMDIVKRTPLSRAAGAGHKDVVELLLEHEADQTIKTREAPAPVAYATKGRGAW